ncbi:methylated-DNA--[protein]-cysteine S-methyltransferase [Zavarzinia sp. CC-PAN008]|uniref:methylated-DNA--[protein]-cysteine S-methyltransferase n=1 Tax=Zavarzinia sp. CC-PAN008 TaxID=3243332 RepID=UPI003F74664C
MAAGLPDTLFHGSHPTPLGDALLVWDGDGILRGLDWADCADRLARLMARHCPGLAPRQAPPPDALSNALDAYFAGSLGALSAVRWATGGTAFQQSVWQALVRIPAGRTQSYAAVAATAGRPGAMRAAGAANGANPISLVVPCHRVIGSDGTLTGYAGGLPRKAWLLRHEGALRGPSASGS